MRRGMIFGVVLAAALTFAAVAFGLSAAELEPKAEEWQAKACTSSLLTSKKAKAGEEAAVCYALKEVAAHKANIQSLSLESAELRSKLATLEAGGGANFAFFTATHVLGGEHVVSPVFDAGKYDRVLIQAEGGDNASWRLEVSDDQTTWLVAAEGQTRMERGTWELAARYARVTVDGYVGTTGEKSFTILAHFN